MYIVQRPVWNETHDENNISMVSVRDKPVSNQDMGDMKLSSYPNVAGGVQMEF